VVSNSSDDCILYEEECKNNRYWWFTEPQQIESSNDLMLLYNDSSASFNSSDTYVPPSEYTALGLFTNDCVSSEGDTDAGLDFSLQGDPFKDSVTDAYKTYSVASVKSFVMEALRSSSCEYDFSRMANNDDDNNRRADNDDDVSASLASTTVALSLCLATLLFLM
jgi:hypothetical protein